LEADDKISLEDINELIPGYIHLNNRKDIHLEYMSKNGQERFQKSLEEIQAGGVEFLNEITDKKSQYIFATGLLSFALSEDEQGTFTFVQRVRNTHKDPFHLYFTVSKKYKNGSSLLSYTQPITELNAGIYLKEIADERFEFYNAHYYKFEQLTNREKEIISLIIEGKTNKQIADILYISYETVKTHRKNIFRKLETSNLLFLGEFYKFFLMNK
jgi:DNA-binding CsgD family transcriptional regulator